MKCFPEGPAAPEVGETVNVEIELPSHHSFGPKCIHCHASVVRVIDNGSSLLVALCAEQMQFRDLSERLPMSPLVHTALVQ